jgi:ABC-2 type transport system ATP-binding protein
MALEKLPSLQADNLYKSYGKFEALKGVSFELYAGQFTTLLGPNGAGKSTLFQVLSGVFRPDAGNVIVDGEALAKNPAKALAKLGVIFQQASLDLSMTVEQNLRFHAALHGMPKRQCHEAIARLLKQFSLDDVGARLTRELSGGNRRKVELARALMHAPRIVLADEATVGLDPGSRASLLAEVKRAVTQDRCAVLWATHLVDEAAQSDRVIVLHQGQILADGSPEQVRQQLGAATLELGFVEVTQRKKTVPAGATAPAPITS